MHRRQADRPNELWQADHTELDVLALDQRGQSARPWLTVVLDDCSRAVCGYTVFLGAPSALNLSLALRQAIRPKSDPGWVVSGLPDVLHADHGSDFTRDHLRQVCADLHVRLVHSAVARPQGRGKLERFLGTVTTELLPLLPGYLVGGKPVTKAALTLAGLDEAFIAWLAGYHQRPHSETHQPPTIAWVADGWLPRATDTAEQLDLLLVMVAEARVVHRDGIHLRAGRSTRRRRPRSAGSPSSSPWRWSGPGRVTRRRRIVATSAPTIEKMTTAIADKIAAPPLGNSPPCAVRLLKSSDRFGQ